MKTIRLKFVFLLQLNNLKDKKLCRLCQVTLHWVGTAILICNIDVRIWKERKSKSHMQYAWLARPISLKYVMKNERNEKQLTSEGQLDGPHMQFDIFQQNHFQSSTSAVCLGVNRTFLSNN